MVSVRHVEDAAADGLCDQCGHWHPTFLTCLAAYKTRWEEENGRPFYLPAGEDQHHAADDSHRRPE